MRLHRLTLQAFGPFPGTESIDFDALDDGILLVNGPTGSGKSSVLDAIAFALFGDVPGARRTLRHTLRSHHAHPEAAPRVELEFSIGPQRWKVERSPQWEAPKRRGTGTTTRQATVLLSQWRDDTWHLVSQRMDEAADMISDTLGMKLDQFAQVVLLPQGEFAQFLRAKPEERLHLLERLFDVSRFDAVERWFTEQKSARVRAQERSLDAIRSHMTVATDAVARLDDETLPSLAWDDTTVPDLPEALRATLAAVSARRQELEAAAAEQETRVRLAERAIESTRQLATNRAAFLRAQDDLDRWPESELATLRQTIDSAERVAGLLRLQERAVRSRRAATQADADIARLRAELDRQVTSPAPTWGDGDWTPERLAEASALLGTLDERATVAERAQRSVNVARDRVEQRAHAAAKAEQARAEAQTAKNASAASADEAADRLEKAVAPTDATSALARLRRTVASAPDRRTERERARAAHEKATRTYAEAETHVLALRRRRLDGMAGELAADLRDDAPCPVCGSATHPDPAAVLPDAPDAATIDDAEETTRRASAAHLEAAARRSAAEERWDAVVHQAEDERSALSAALANVGVAEPATTDALLTDPASLDDIGQALQALTSAHERAADDVLAAREAASRDETSLAAAEKALAAASSALEAARESAREAETALERSLDAVDESLMHVPPVHLAALGHAVPQTPDHIRSAPDDDGRDGRLDASSWLEALTAMARDARPALREIAATLTRLERAQHDAAHAARTADDAERDVQDELVAKGYDSVDAARAVALAEDELAELALRWQDGVERRAAALAVVADPVIASAAFVPVSDEARLRTRADILTRRARESATLAARWHQSLDVLESMRHQVADAVREHLPLAEAAAEMSELAATFTGTGENTHRMRLTSYVLAARLETVTAMANERLARMTDGRYQLRHTDERVRGTSKSGLGLLVVDAWTGRSRDTATLSGGEAFMASLALALGLGDAVRADSGGMELHTLFVDEGFGSLDQDTLEHVMEVLDGLREGGRLVGVVSHVTELRARIPTHIEVRKTAEGSTIHTRSAARIDASPTP